MGEVWERFGGRQGKEKWVDYIIFSKFQMIKKRIKIMELYF